MFNLIINIFIRFISSLIGIDETSKYVEKTISAIDKVKDGKLGCSSDNKES